jgi:glycosyltransferase involved in cell wall biosynthesis
MPRNRFLIDLNDGLTSAGCEIVHNHETFWSMQGEFDIVHLHFPEYITYEIEACLKTDLTPEIFHLLEERLRFWKARAPIVVTRHVFLPHRRPDRSFQKLYELVYRYADGIVHFAEASHKEYTNRYRQCLSNLDQLHAIIPHHNYASLPNEVSKEKARRQIGMPAQAKVMLVFGSIINDEESYKILNTFNSLNMPRKVLLAGSWREKLPEVKWIRLKYWLRDLIRFYYRLHPRYHYHYGFVDEQEVQFYLNASDILFIPRGNVLNSGNMILGFTFGRVVVGPDSGTVGQILRETGNPVFDPDNPESTVGAVTSAFQLAEKGLGERNRQLALSEWTVKDCVKKHIDLYETLLEKRHFKKIQLGNYEQPKASVT